VFSQFTISSIKSGWSADQG